MSRISRARTCLGRVALPIRSQKGSSRGPAGRRCASPVRDPRDHQAVTDVAPGGFPNPAAQVAAGSGTPYSGQHEPRGPLPERRPPLNRRADTCASGGRGSAPDPDALGRPHGHPPRTEGHQTAPAPQGRSSRRALHLMAR